jgi:hypothetical protein
VLNTATATSGPGQRLTPRPLPQNPAIQILKTGTLNPAETAFRKPANHHMRSRAGYRQYHAHQRDRDGPDIAISGGRSLAGAGRDGHDLHGVYVDPADIDAGTFTNTATVSTDEGPTDTDDDTQPLAQDIELTLVKTATPQTYTAVSQNIDYSFQLTNTGNVTLSAPFGIVDDVSTDEACPGTPTSLAPGESITCTATHTITQGDLDAGSVTNTAQGSALDPDAQTVNPTRTRDGHRRARGFAGAAQDRDTWNLRRNR